MADNYTLSSFCYRVDTKKFDDFLHTFKSALADYYSQENMLWLDPKSPEGEAEAVRYADCVIDSKYVEETGMYDIFIYHNYSIDLHAVVLAVAKAHSQHGDGNVFMFDWASTCSKPRTDEFCGGTVCIFPDGGYYYAGGRTDALMLSKLHLSTNLHCTWSSADLVNYLGVDTKEAETLFNEMKDAMHRVVEKAGWEAIIKLLKEKGLV